MRDRLVALINEAKDEYPTIPTVNCCKPTFAYYLADHFLANGVIVPPVKMRQTIYSIERGITNVFVGEVYEICMRREAVLFRATRKGYFTLVFTADDIGKTVFFTSEEAEQALKGIERR